MLAIWWTLVLLVTGSIPVIALAVQAVPTIAIMSDKSNWQQHADSKERDAVSDKVNPDDDVWIPEDEYDEHDHD